MLPPEAPVKGIGMEHALKTKSSNPMSSKSASAPQSQRFQSVAGSSGVGAGGTGCSLCSSGSGFGSGSARLGGTSVLTISAGIDGSGGVSSSVLASVS